ncbi:MAG: hypothetical protein WA700_12360 [Acidobacteriaceae bacterium]
MITKLLRYLAMTALLLPLVTAAQTLYTSPDGRFTLQVPTGWQIKSEPELSTVTFRNGAVSVSVLVSQQHKSNAMTAKQFIDGNIDELKGQCPTFQNRQKGPTTLVGFPALTSTSTCSDARSPAVAEDFATLTPDYLLIGFTVISPLSLYYEMLPVLDDMRASLRIIGHPAPPTPKPTKSEASIALEKACLVSAFSQEDCARRQGMLIGKEDPGSDTHFPNVYRDPAGRFSIEFPSGWKAISEGDNGVSGVQLRSGSYWINLMPRTANNPKELVLHHEQAIAASVNSTRTPPFGRAGLIQLFGHGLEITFDNFSASSPAGDPIDSYIAGVGSISGTNHNLLLIVASLPGSSPKSASAAPVVPFFAIAQSIRLGDGVNPAPPVH